jgi:tRNA uridine 5-carboxymethylaminomethyl modification enzyme
LRAYENTLIPVDFDFTKVDGLSNEVKQKLAAARPETLARAQRISGITPAAISQLLMYLKKHGLLKKMKPAGEAEQQAS